MTDLSVCEKQAQKLLLVEDQGIIALAQKQILQKNGYNVVLAYSAQQAVQIATSEPELSLILMDIDLGEGPDGAEAAERILAERDIPIVFLSAHTEPEVVEKTEGITSYGYIVKNSGETVLMASIRMAFRLYEERCKTKQQSRMLSSMLEISRQLMLTIDLQTILQYASDRLSEIAGLNTGAIYLINDNTISLKATTPALPHDFPDQYRHALLSNHPHIHRAITSRNPVFVADTSLEEFTEDEEGVVRLRNLSSILYVPLISRKKVIGVYISGAIGDPVQMAGSVIDLCVTLANIAAVAAENAMLLKQTELSSKQ